jgi:hypothetical protein
MLRNPISAFKPKSSFKPPAITFPKGFDTFKVVPVRRFNEQVRSHGKDNSKSTGWLNALGIGAAGAAAILFLYSQSAEGKEGEILRGTERGSGPERVPSGHEQHGDRVEGEALSTSKKLLEMSSSHPKL